MLYFFLDDEYGERCVSVNLDGEESELVFIDHPAGEMSVSTGILESVQYLYILEVRHVNKSLDRLRSWHRTKPWVSEMKLGGFLTASYALLPRPYNAGVQL